MGGRMSHKIFSKKFSIALITIIWSWNSPIYAQSLMTDFENLFERCRMSVETNTAFDIEGLQPADVGERQIREWGINTAQEAWIPPGSDLYVVLTEWTARDGTTRNICDIYPADEKYPLNQDEQERLLQHFLMRQAELIGSGTHEIDTGLTPLPPMINAAFLKSVRNPNGCTVTNNIALLSDGTYFVAGSGEQAIRPCKRE
jgi:hypothetical protein